MLDFNVLKKIWFASVNGFLHKTPYSNSFVLWNGRWVGEVWTTGGKQWLLAAVIMLITSPGVPALLFLSISRLPNNYL